MKCDRCKRNIESEETVYTVQYDDVSYPEDICESCLDKDSGRFYWIS